MALALTGFVAMFDQNRKVTTSIGYTSRAKDATTCTL